MTTTSLFSISKLFFIGACLFLLYSVVPAQAQVSGIPAGLELNGYAWSSNIGWISLNCRTGGAGRSDICNTNDYQVRITQAGNLMGYAWSPNIGWIRFNDFPSTQTFQERHPFPVANGVGGTSYVRPSVTGTYTSATNHNLTFRGWALTCAIFENRDGSMGCSGHVLSDMYKGGWDGWISLNGTNYGVNSANFGSPQYVWGSTVVGWVDISSHVNFYSPTALTGTGCTITTVGQSTCNGNLNWSIASDVSSPTIVRTLPTPQTTISTSRTGTNQSVVLRLGSNTFAVRSGVNGANISTLNLTVSCGGGLVPVEGACQLPPPDAVVINSLTANPGIVRRGGTVVINWSLSRVPVAGQCTLSGPGFSGSSSVDIADLSNYTTPALNATSRITLDCGTSRRDVTITVVPAFNEI
jgi:hypothetical protein